MERKTLFINKYDFNKDMLKEYIKSFSTGNLFLFGIMAVIFSYISYVEFSNKNMFMAVLLLFIAVASAVYLFAYIPLTIRTMEKNPKTYSTMTIDIGDIDVKIKNEFGENTVYYTSFTELKESKNNYYLMLGKNSGIVISKEGFIKGNREEFKSFMDGKIVRRPPMRTG